MEILNLKNKIVSEFNHENWQEIGILTQSSDWINNHGRLLRSLSWGDEDYGGHVLSYLQYISSISSNNLDIIKKYIENKFESKSEYISSKPSEKKITFAPYVFEVLELDVEKELVSVMMPFKQEFHSVYSSIQKSCNKAALNCLRADDIWEESTIIQDVFNLIYRSNIVIVDLKDKNPNVMY